MRHRDSPLPHSPPLTNLRPFSPSPLQRAMYIRYALYGLAALLALVGAAVAWMRMSGSPLAGSPEAEDSAVVRERARQAAEDRAK